ncbi:MAG: DNA alkylation repair protein [Pseudomonadota bacterium]
MATQDVLSHLRTVGDADRAVRDAAYHKTEREVLGVPVPVLTDVSKDLRRQTDLDGRIALADGLWQSGVFEARILAAKLFVQARIPEDDTVWALLVSWVPEFDGWAIADTASGAIARRLTADPSRLDVVEAWASADALWTKRAAFVTTLPWTKQRHPKPDDQAVRERVLTWATQAVTDHRWFIQKAIGCWLRDLSKRDPDRVVAFLALHAAQMKPFAAKEAGRLL